MATLYALGRTKNDRLWVVSVNKEKIKDKIIKNGKEQYLSAQAYDKLTSDEKKLIKEVLTDEKKDTGDYERKMKAMWPKIFEPKPLVWRKR